MSPEPIVQEARRLLDHGHGLEARELLLRKGFIRASQPEIQAAFISLRPPSPTLRKMLDGPYRDLQSGTAATRLRGLVHIAREITSDSPLDGVRWMRHPQASKPLMGRLSDRAAARDPSVPVRSSARTALEAGQLKAPPGKT